MQTTQPSILSNRMDAHSATHSPRTRVPLDKNGVGSDFSDVFRNSAFQQSDMETEVTEQRSVDAEIDSAKDAESDSDTSLSNPQDKESSGSILNAKETSAVDDAPMTSDGAFVQDAKANVQMTHVGSKRMTSSHQTVSAAFVNGVAHQNEVAQDANIASLRSADATRQLQHERVGNNGGLTGPVQSGKILQSVQAGTQALTDVDQMTTGPRHIANPELAESSLHRTSQSSSVTQAIVGSSSSARSFSIAGSDFGIHIPTTQSEAAIAVPQSNISTHPITSPKNGTAFDSLTSDAHSPRIEERTQMPALQETTHRTAPLAVNNNPAMQLVTSIASTGRDAPPSKSEELSLRALASEPAQMAQKQPMLTAPLSAAMATVSPSAGNVKLEMSSVHSLDAVEEFAWDLRPQTASISTHSQTPSPMRHEMPGHIAQQLAQAMHRNPDRPVELALNPAELGRVRMTLTTTDTGIVVNILADRPETLDLMRRNIDDLGESFADLGYDDISFAFGQNDDPSDASSDGQPGSSEALVLDLEEHEHAAPTHPETPHLAISADGIDLRL